MEKFQMLFPYSSATSPIMRNNCDVYGNNFEGGHSLLGLKIDNYGNHLVSSSVVPNNNNNNKEDDDKLIIRRESGSMEGDQQRQSVIKGTKKGEKKMRKQRFAFQTRSQVDILDDGYRWRKYGQKAVKNNKFPRSYYRCTYEGCNVKKQVQRLTKDEGVVVTTYEGIHSHPIQRPTENFEHILKQMQIYTPF